MNKQLIASLVMRELRQLSKSVLSAFDLAA